MTMTETETAPEVASEATLTAPEIASYLEVSPKALRRFIRSQDAACGQGNRYNFSLEEAKALIRDFNNRSVRNTQTARSAAEVASLLEDDLEVDEVDA